MLTRKLTRPLMTFDADNGGGGGGGDQTVPYDRFKQKNDEAAAEKQRADELQKQLDAKAREGLPELEALKAQVADLTKERDQALEKSTAAEKQVTDLERAGWVREAAAAVTFKDGDKEVTGAFFDAGDALARINLDEIRSADGAKREVAALAAKSRHLVQVPDGDQTADTQAGRLRQVLKNGEALDPDAAKEDPSIAPATEDEAIRNDLRSAYAEPTT